MVSFGFGITVKSKQGYFPTKPNKLWIACGLLPVSHLAAVTRFPALVTDWKISRAWSRARDFPRLEPGARFPALGAGCKIARVWSRLHVLPRLGSFTTVYFCEF